MFLGQFGGQLCFYGSPPNPCDLYFIPVGVSIHKEIPHEMTFDRPIDFINFIEEHSEELLTKGSSFRHLVLLKKVVQTCCKCIRKEKMQEFFDFYMNLGKSMTQEEKEMLASTAGEKVFFKNPTGGEVFLEVG